MKEISYTQARANLAALLDATLHEKDGILITRRSSNSVVVLSTEQYLKLTGKAVPLKCAELKL